MHYTIIMVVSTAIAARFTALLIVDNVTAYFTRRSAAKSDPYECIPILVKYHTFGVAEGQIDAMADRLIAIHAVTR